MAEFKNKGFVLDLQTDEGRTRCHLVLPVDENDHFGRACTGCKRLFGIIVFQNLGASLTCPTCGAKGNFFEFNTPDQETLIQQRWQQESWDRAHAFDPTWKRKIAEHNSFKGRPSPWIHHFQETIKPLTYECGHCPGKEFSTEVPPQQCPFCGQGDAITTLTYAKLRANREGLPAGLFHEVQNNSRNLKMFLLILVLAILCALFQGAKP